MLNRIIKKAFKSKIFNETKAFKTFIIDRIMRRIFKVYKKQLIRIFLFKIFIVNERFAVNKSIN